MPPAIVLTAFGNIETAIATIHDLGAFWFLEKPIQPQALRVLVERAASQSRLAEETERLQRQLHIQGVLVDHGRSVANMQKCSRLIRQVAPSKAAVLVTGESGTGKELVARAIHHLEPPARRTVRCYQLCGDARTLMECELFGHEKGALYRRHRASCGLL